MKRLIPFVLLPAAIFSSALAGQTAPANFSGSWLLNKEKSHDLPPMLSNVESYTLTVTQDDQQLRVETKLVGGQGMRSGAGRGQGAGEGEGRPPRDRGGPPADEARSPGGERPGPRRGMGAWSGPPVLVYRLDGKDSKQETEGGMPGSTTLKAAWKKGGQILELSSIREMSFQGQDVSLMNKERWELQEEGKVLAVQRTSDTPRGVMEYRLVFNRQH